MTAVARRWIGDALPTVAEAVRVTPSRMPSPVRHPITLMRLADLFSDRHDLPVTDDAACTARGYERRFDAPRKPR